MPASPISPDLPLPELLADRARSVSRRRLTLDVTLGLAAGVLAVWWRPTGWVVALSAALCFAAFGAWGLADRVLHARASNGALLSPPRRVPDELLAATRAAAAVVGSAAAVLLVFALLAVTLGRFIS